MGRRYWLGIAAACCAGAVIGLLQGFGDWTAPTIFLVSLGALLVIGSVAFRDDPSRRGPRGDGRGPRAS